MRDPLIGKRFLATRQHNDGCRTWPLRGQIIGKSGGGVFLGSVESGSQTLESLGDMRGRKLYESEDLRDTATAGTGDGLGDETHGRPERRTGAGS
jgi:hypothetical protein